MKLFKKKSHSTGDLKEPSVIVAKLEDLRDVSQSEIERNHYEYKAWLVLQERAIKLSLMPNSDENAKELCEYAANQVDFYLTAYTAHTERIKKITALSLKAQNLNFKSNISTQMAQLKSTSGDVNTLRDDSIEAIAKELMGLTKDFYSADALHELRHSTMETNSKSLNA